MYWVVGPSCRDCDYGLAKYDDGLIPPYRGVRSFGEENDDAPKNLTDVDGTLYFVNGDDDEHLWRSDGTTEGTVIVPHDGEEIEELAGVDGHLFFSDEDGLWVIRSLEGDFDRDSVITARDIDMLFAAIGAGANDPFYDLTGDSVVDHADLTHLVENILETSVGDANLDGKVDREDVATVVRNFGRADSPGWRDGNFDGDEQVDVLDLVLLQASLDPPLASAPLAFIAFQSRRGSDAALRATDATAQRAAIAAGRVNARVVETTTRRTYRRVRLDAPAAETLSHADRSVLRAVRTRLEALAIAQGGIEKALALD